MEFLLIPTTEVPVGKITKCGFDYVSIENNQVHLILTIKPNSIEEVKLLNDYISMFRPFKTHEKTPTFEIVNQDESQIERKLTKIEKCRILYVQRDSLKDNFNITLALNVEKAMVSKIDRIFPYEINRCQLLVPVLEKEELDNGLLSPFSNLKLKI